MKICRKSYTLETANMVINTWYNVVSRWRKLPSRNPNILLNALFGLKWLGNIVEGWWKKWLNFCIKCYLLHSFYCTNPLTGKKSWKNSQTTKISMVFFEGVDVRHPLTVINSKFSQPFLNFPNRFSMKKRHKTGYKKSVNT